MMRNDTCKKTLVLGIIVLFFGMSITTSIGTRVVKKSTPPLSNSKTLYVGGSGPGNYSTIQSAINASSDRDTIYVYNNIYYEHVRIDKDINLFGQDKEKTVIDAGGKGTAVEIGANVNLNGFTIRNAEEGISNFSPPPPNNIYKFFVYGNIIKYNAVGLALGGTLNNVIHDNIISYNQLGINFFYADDYEVSNNNFIKNEKHAYFEYILFLQFMPRIKWYGNFWDDWNFQLPRIIKGEKVVVMVFRPGYVMKNTVCKWYNIDWHPEKDPYDIGV